MRVCAYTQSVIYSKFYGLPAGAFWRRLRIVNARRSREAVAFKALQAADLALPRYPENTLENNELAAFKFRTLQPSLAGREPSIQAPQQSPDRTEQAG